MTEQILPKLRPSKFAGTLFRVRIRGNFVSAFLWQVLIAYLGATLLRLLIAIAVGDFFGRFYVGYDIFNLSLLLLTVMYVLAIWFIVWLIKHFNPIFLAHLLPASFVKQLAATASVPSIIQEAFDKESAYTEREAMLSNKLRSIAAIDERITTLRVRANFMLYAAGLLLVGASLIIVFAGTLTNLDASAVSNVDKISKDITDSEKRLARLSQIEELKKTYLTDPNAAKKLANMTDGDSSLPISDNGIGSAIADEQKRLAQAQTLLHEAWEKELLSQRGYSDSRYIIATAITRIGVVLVIIFLAQVLIGLYRYNTRLITFYNSRRDLLQVWDGKGASVEKLQKLMVPNVDFGREPKHPLEDIIRQVLAKIHPPAVNLSTAAEKGSSQKH